MIPWGAVQVAARKGKILIDATKRELKHAPDFDTNDWPDCGDLAQTTVIDELQGVPAPHTSGEAQATT